MKYRYERKYLVPNHCLNALRERVTSFCRPDIFADEGKAYPEYTVRSIYLDTPRLDSLLDKVEGIKERKKLRIRGYNDLKPDTNVFLEIKRKTGNRIFKNRALIPYSQLEEIMDFGLNEEVEQLLKSKNQLNDACKFLYNKNKFLQTPVNIITYNREPYHGKIKSDTRITLDKNIRSKFYPNFSELFSDTNFTYIWKDHFILEIKYYRAPMPIWAKSIVFDFKLQSQALSKYCEGYYCHKINNKYAF